MTKLLDNAIASIRDMSDDDQDEAAELLFSFRVGIAVPSPLTKTRKAIEEGRQQARRGEFATDAEMSAFFRRHRE